MGIIDDQALDTILHQEFKQQIFAFAPSPPCSQPKSGQQKVPQGRFFGLVLRSRYRQDWIAPPAHHPGLTLGSCAQIVDAHGLAAAWFRHNHMPSPQLPRLTQ